ncbi:MAG: NADP-dependent malic enzyme [Thermoplasmata archaeon]|nr:NADP-dependent malic enzyme [Thermoplasmata archaeon]MCI4332289.1 NADP-dependent malic enzyme [Thermoplasmata archaeon]
MVQAEAPPSGSARGTRRKARPDPDEKEATQTAALSERSVRLAKFYQGKVEMVPKVPVRSLEDFGLWYTPGIAAVSKAIQADKDASFDLTGRWNTIAIVTDGSRVLGLGNIGPEAALPVMEGKALLFKYLGGVDAFPLPIQVASAEELVETVERIAPAVGGVNLEDIASPKCFFVLEQLQKRLPVPVWHDDQLGTAASTVAGLLNALKLTGRTIGHTRTVLLGAGAANLATARLLIALGHDPSELTLVDQKGILHAERVDLDELMLHNPWKYRIALATDGGGRKGNLSDALVGADVLLAASTPGPHTVKPDEIGRMAKSSIVFALANPVPEIYPSAALDAGAAIVATGRSDFPNQVNNSLIFPGVFRGVLDARARSIPDELVLAAAYELAARAEDVGLTPTHILPTMGEAGVFPHVAAAVAVKAVELGLARRRHSRSEFLERARARMARPALLAKALEKAGLIAPMPDERNEPRKKP